MTTDPYDGAPDLAEETTALDKLRLLITEQGPLYREYLLRHAVHVDRLHTDLTWSNGEDEALKAAWALIQYDRQNATWLGGLGPDSNTWTTEDGALQYVQREWQHWAQQNASPPDAPTRG